MRFTDTDISEMQRLRGLNFSQEEIAQKFKVSQTYISRILNKQKKKEVENGANTSKSDT